MITSAYNFAPLRRHVLQPEWQDIVCQDVPLQDGVCAELELELVNHTPLLVAGSDAEDNRKKQFHKHPDGVPSIPGSSLRGMVRSVLEIVTSARMQLIDDRALSLRDLYLDDYKDRMRRTPEVGWLRFDAGTRQWVIRLADLEFIEHTNLQRMGSHHSTIYAAWKKASLDEKRLASLKYRAIGRPIVLQRRVTPASAQAGPQVDSKKGWVVFTGQPGAMDADPEDHQRHNKHREFIFFDRDAKDALVVPVPEGVMHRFLQVHDQSVDWNYLSGPDSVLKSVGIPVFFHRAESGQIRHGSVESLGLAMMYRIPGRRTLGEMAMRQQDEGDRNRLDFVETLFGCIDEASAGRASRRSRVSFGDLRWSGPGKQAAVAAPQFLQPTLLGQPKPSFYPSYIVQTQRDGTVTEYKTILSRDAKLSGWKRYPVRPLSMVALTPPNKDNSQVNVQLEPLAPSQVFKGRVRLHNVKTEELGAILWCLTWGGDSNLRHALGMGKSFGFGQVSVRVTSFQVRRNDRNQDCGVSIGDAINTFQAWMSAQSKSWQSDLKDLLAMANPKRAQAARLVPLRLDAKGNRNEFSEAKKAKQALQSYAASSET